MRAIAIILTAVSIALAGLTLALYITADVTVTDISCTAEDAAGREAEFLAIREQARNGIFTGTLFGSAGDGETAPGGAGEYLFYTYTMLVNNNTFLPMKTAEIQVSPMNEDILQLPESRQAMIPPRGQGTVQATILTRKESHPVRELTLTYYLWGLPFTIRTAYSK